MIRINLIPAEYLVKHKKKMTAVFAGAAVGVAGLAIGSASIVIITRARALAAQVRELENQEKQLAEVAKEVDALEARKNSVNAKNSVIEGLLAGRLIYTKLLEAVVGTVPPGQIAFKSMGTKKNSDGEFDLNLQVGATGMPAVVKWLERLENAPAISSIKVGNISNSLVGASFPVAFKIKAE